MTPKRHSLKCWPEPYEAMRSGRKVHEFRRNDRDFSVGDILEINEWNPETKEPTGSAMFRRVTYVGTGFGIPDGYVCLSVEKIEAPKDEPMSTKPTHPILNAPQVHMLLRRPDKWEAPILDLDNGDGRLSATVWNRTGYCHNRFLVEPGDLVKWPNAPEDSWVPVFAVPEAPKARMWWLLCDDEQSVHYMKDSAKYDARAQGLSHILKITWDGTAAPPVVEVVEVGNG